MLSPLMPVSLDQGKLYGAEPTLDELSQFPGQSVTNEFDRIQEGIATQIPRMLSCLRRIFSSSQMASNQEVQRS